MVDSCPACGSKNLDVGMAFADGLCKDCGLVLDGGVKSYIHELKTPRDEKGTSDGADWAEEVKITDSSDKQLVCLFERLDEVACSLEMGSEEINQAAEIIAESWKLSFLHGRSKNATVGAAIAVACREYGRPRPLGIVAESVGVNDKKLQTTFKELVKRLGLSLNPPTPDEFITYLGHQLNVPESTIIEARDLIKGEQANLVGNPVGHAAAALYLRAKSSERDVSLRETAEAAGIVKETVWKRKEDMIERISL